MKTLHGTGSYEDFFGELTRAIAHKDDVGVVYSKHDVREENHAPCVHPDAGEWCVDIDLAWNTFMTAARVELEIRAAERRLAES